MKEAPTPDIITVYSHPEGYLFRYEWYCNEEYIALTKVGVTDPQSIMARCQKAWDEENGIYLDYSGFLDGLRRRVRIISCFDVSEDASKDASEIGIKTSEPISVVKFRVVLSEKDHLDYVVAMENDWGR